MPAVACGTKTCSSPSPYGRTKSAHSRVRSCTASRAPVWTWKVSLRIDAAGQPLLDPLDLARSAAPCRGPARRSALSTSPTRGEVSATVITACFTTAITSSHSPSMLVNIALVSVGSPDSRMTRTASATDSLTPPVSSPPEGLMLIATSMAPR